MLSSSFMLFATNLSSSFLLLAVMEAANFCGSSLPNSESIFDWEKPELLIQATNAIVSTIALLNLLRQFGNGVAIKRVLVYESKIIFLNSLSIPLSGYHSIHYLFKTPEK